MLKFYSPCATGLNTKQQHYNYSELSKLILSLLVNADILDFKAAIAYIALLARPDTTYNYE
jgi:hypothetical protein